MRESTSVSAVDSYGRPYREWRIMAMTSVDLDPELIERPAERVRRAVGVTFRRPTNAQSSESSESSSSGSRGDTGQSSG